MQHIFVTEEGEICLNSSGHLNHLLDKYAFEGAKCNVTYAGKVLLTKGNMKGKEAHNFELEIDDADKAPVRTRPASSEPVYEEDDIAL